MAPDVTPSLDMIPVAEMSSQATLSSTDQSMPGVSIETLSLGIVFGIVGLALLLVGVVAVLLIVRYRVKKRTIKYVIFLLFINKLCYLFCIRNIIPKDIDHDTIQCEFIVYFENMQNYSEILWISIVAGLVI